MSFNLEHALEDLAEAGAARRTADDDALTSRVGLMATRIRRRRALRYTGTTVVAACAVGALAVGVAFLPGLLRDGPTPPAGTPSGTTEPTTEDPDGTPVITTLAPVELGGLCGASPSELESIVRRDDGRSDLDPGPGSARVLSVEESPDSPLAEYQYDIPVDTSEVLIHWQTVITQSDSVVAISTASDTEPQETHGATSTEVLVPVTAACGYDGVVEPGLSEIQVIVSATLVGDDGEVRHERAVSEPFEFVMPGASTHDPVAQAFVCGQPGPESIHTLPDAGGLTLAVDLPEGPWDTLTAIPATIGATDGRTIIANVSQGSSFALVDETGNVVGFVYAHSPDGVELVEVGPDATATVTATTFLTTCGPDGISTAAGAEEGIEGTFTLWPYVTAVIKEVTDAEGNAVTPSSDPVIVIANPQQMTFTK